VHAHGCLPPKLCGVAHLPRDGTGCEKDAARRSVRVGSLHAAGGEPGHQPSRDTPITTRTRASIFAPEGFASRNLLGTRAIWFSRASATRIMSRKKRPNAATSSHRWAQTWLAGDRMPLTTRIDDGCNGVERYAHERAIAEPSRKHDTYCPDDGDHNCGGMAHGPILRRCWRAPAQSRAPRPIPHEFRSRMTSTRRSCASACPEA
jgi:hypothetical protein